MSASVTKLLGSGAPLLALVSVLAGFPGRAEETRATIGAAQTLATIDAPGAAIGLPAAASALAQWEETPASDTLAGPTSDPDQTGALAPDTDNPDGSAPRPAEAPDRAEVGAPPSINMALKAALEARANPEVQGPLAVSSRKEREAIAAFYIGRDFAPLWSSDGTPNAEVAPVIERLSKADEDGLDLAGFPLRSFEGSGVEALAAADLALTDAVVAYGRQASGSRIDPRTISTLIAERPEIADAAIILANVATAGAEAGTVLGNFNPRHKAYLALREKLGQLPRRRAPTAREPHIPAGPTLRVGMRDPRVPLVRARLSLDGQRWDAPENSLYDTKIAAAVADFQKANGLPASGMLTARTLAAMSGGRPSGLEAEILANMERWRWMPRDLGETHIEVNIPAFEAVVIDSGRVVQRHRVVVGKEETPTPVFSNSMQFLIVNPYWNVPPSILRKEMLPRLSADPHYLSRHGYQVFSRDGRLAVRQPPGERNALGRIKFMFPNDYAVYMHDTPSRALFDEERRAFSHGCVRVDDPFRFAETVLGRGNGWSEQRIQKLIGGKERYVHLPKPLPVHIEYFTAFVDETGYLQTREDLYGYSRRVRAALGLGG